MSENLFIFPHRIGRYPVFQINFFSKHEIIKSSLQNWESTVEKRNKTFRETLQQSITGGSGDNGNSDKSGKSGECGDSDECSSGTVVGLWRW
jgi:hypothetical protein